MLLFDTNYEIILYTLIVLSVVWLLTRFLRYLAFYPENSKNRGIPLGESVGSHHFVPGGFFFPLHCVICQFLLLTPSGDERSGYHCTDCGLATCDQKKCLQVAQVSHTCKEVALNVFDNKNQNEEEEKVQSRGVFKHHWVQGNLPLLAECDVCENCCSESPQESLEDLKCCWCQRAVHKRCLPKISEICDLGEFSKFIVPANLVTAKTTKQRMMMVTVGRNRMKWKITQVSSPTTTTSKSGNNCWSPLIVIGNTKAGNHDGATYLNAFRGILNPAQVIDLSSWKVEDGLKWCKLIKERCTILIAGGDGTIGWVLNTIDDLKLEPRPLIALLPLGTGNDLARTLGFGSGSTHSNDVNTILRTVKEDTEETNLDRWKLSITPNKHSMINFIKTTSSSHHSHNNVEEIFIQNYMSVGVDALVTYNFHKTRENQNVPFSGRLFNKLLYFLYGTKDVLERECQDLDQILELHMDGVRQDLPNIESVVVLNIPCWGAGVRPWELGQGHEDYAMPAYNDKKLEVFCVYSSFHIAQMQVGLSEPHRIGQAIEVKIILKGKAPMQTDGEPWLQGPAEILIQHHNSIPILRVKN